MANENRPKKRSNKILIIDATGQDKVEFGLILGQRYYAFKSATDYQNRDELLVTLKRFLHRKNIKLRDLTGLVVVKGPGPFTAVRVSVAIANALHFSLQMPLYAVAKTGDFMIKNVFDRMRLGKISKTEFVKPIYNHPPNITKPKKINKMKSGAVI
ncbi:MAG: hypothetical protein PHI73_01705 [Patescibacteria group bacterium]|nr:hypothetical protein [Patescibacteria group bacterium]